MELSDLLVSYNQVRVPERVELPESLSDYSYDYPIISQTTKKEEEKKEEDDLTSNYYISTIKAPGFSKVKGSAEFELAYDEVEKTNPEARKYRTFLTKMALKESGFNKSIQNLAGAPAYGYFLFMLDGKKYNNISKFAGTDIETFRNNPKLQIEAAIKLAKSFEKGFSKEDLKLAKELGFTTFGLLGGAWLAGNGGVRKFLKGQGNPSDRHWSKNNKGTDVATRIREFNFKSGGVIRKYLNAGTIEPDNTRVSKPIILLRIPMTYHLPSALFVQDNRSNYEKEQSLKQADAAYNLYIEDKKTEEGLNDLIGFLTFTDYATMGLGAGSLLTKGAKLIGKRISNNLPRYAHPNWKGDGLVLIRDRMRNGGFDRLRNLTTNKYYKGVPLENYNNFDEEALRFLLNANPKKGKSSDFKANPKSAAISDLRLRFYTEVFEDAPSKYQTSLINNILTSHEYSHLIYQPDWNNKVGLKVYNPPNHKNYLLNPKSGGLAELTARGTQLKNYFGLKEGEDITPEMWEYAKKNYVRDTGLDNNMTDWFNGVRDIPEYLKWLNKNAPVMGVPILYSKMLNNDNSK